MTCEYGKNCRAKDRKLLTDGMGGGGREDPRLWRVSAAHVRKKNKILLGYVRVARRDSLA